LHRFSATCTIYTRTVKKEKVSIVENIYLLTAPPSKTSPQSKSHYDRTKTGRSRP